MIEAVRGVVDELTAALDGLAPEDLTPLFGPALLDRLRPLLVAQNRLAAEVARTVREAEVSGAAEVDGLTTTASWLRGHGHLSAGEAARVLRTGRAAGVVARPRCGVRRGAVTAEQAAGIARVAGDERAHAQQSADALVQLGDNALAAGSPPTLRGHKPQVLVKVDLEDLVDPGTGRGAAGMGFGAQISAARARWLACDGAVTRIVLGPDGVPRDHGRTLRLFPPHVRRVAEVRDAGCVFAGCAAPTWWCDVHHVLAWIDGGETNLANAALLCERHSHQGPPRLPRRTTTGPPLTSAA